MKKVIAVLGSPRKKGNSTLLAAEAARGVEDSGGLCESLYLQGMKISPCRACDFCHNDESRRCVIDDDMPGVHAKLNEADAFIIASPVYMFNYSAQLKLFLDRCYPVLRFFKEKPVGIVLTYGETDENASGAINAIHALKDQFRYCRSVVVGVVHGSAVEAGEVAGNKPLLQKAYDLGRALIR